jgi:hypothetical protein
MRGPANHDAATIGVADTGASGVQSQVTIAADSTQYWVIDSISWSYGGAPAAGTAITIAYGSGPTTKFTMYAGGNVNNGGTFGHIEWQRGYHYDSETLNEQCVITAAASAGVVSSLNVTYH